MNNNTEIYQSQIKKYRRGLTELLKNKDPEIPEDEHSTSYYKDVFVIENVIL
ncbi:hypothetical protein LF817_15875 [Halobacillus sp. A1]|nr:hypothetical protein [Halobacillus sp. A1]